jgi:hypothetical protein
MPALDLVLTDDPPSLLSLPDDISLELGLTDDQPVSPLPPLSFFVCQFPFIQSDREHAEKIGHNPYKNMPYHVSDRVLEDSRDPDLNAQIASKSNLKTAKLKT